MSQKEYIEDLQEPLKKMPQMKMGMIVLCLIPILGTLAFIGHMVHTNKKAKKHVQKVFDAFNEKYERSRGVHISLTMITQMTRNGQAMVETILITVKQPGVPIPGVPLFTLSKEGLMAVQAYQNGVQTGTSMAAAAPGMTPMAPEPAATYATPTGFPSAEPSADMPAGFEIDPTAPYPYPM